MNIAVCVNHVPDTATKIKIDASGTSIDSNGVTFILNPYDEFAIEEALKTKEKLGGTVYVITLGADNAQETIRKALAMGADEGILLKADNAPDSIAVAHALASEIKSLNCELVFMGKQSVDNDAGVMAQLVGESLGYSSVSVVTSFVLDGSSITCEREIEGGKEVVSLSLPAVIGCQKGLNEPRYASLKGIMAAKKKTIAVKDAQTSANTSTVKELSLPKGKAPGKIVGTDASAVAELVRLLHEEAKVF